MKRFIKKVSDKYLQKLYKPGGILFQKIKEEFEKID